MACIKIPKLAIIAAANICPLWAVITSIIPKRAAKNISRDPNIGAIYAKTGEKKIRHIIEKTPPKNEAEYAKLNALRPSPLFVIG